MNGPGDPEATVVRWNVGENDFLFTDCQAHTELDRHKTGRSHLLVVERTERIVPSGMPGSAITLLDFIPTPGLRPAKP